MASEGGGMERGMEVGMNALKTFANPSLDIVKTIPQGIIELCLRGAAIVSFQLLSVSVSS